MLKESREEIRWRIENAVNSKLYNPWISNDMQNYLREMIVMAAFEIVEAIYTEQELEQKAENILLDVQQD